MSEFTQFILEIAFKVIVVFAFLGMVDYVVESVTLFVAALRRYIERHRK